MDLSGTQAQVNWSAFCINQSVDLGGQAAPGTEVVLEFGPYCSQFKVDPSFTSCCDFLDG